MSRPTREVAHGWASSPFLEVRDDDLLDLAGGE